jgi:hypothetical protein
MVETYTLKNTNTGKFKSVKNPVARGKAGIFCRTRQRAFNSLRLKNQPQDVKNQWKNVKNAVNADCERLIKFANGNGKYTNDFNLGYILDVQNSINRFETNLKILEKKNLTKKNNTKKMNNNEDPQPFTQTRNRKQYTRKQK